MSRRSKGTAKRKVVANRPTAVPAAGHRAAVIRRLVGLGVAAAAVVGLVVALALGGGGGGKPGAVAASEGAPAPEGTFLEADGKAQTVASLRGKPTLLWFVSTWCSSCQAGTRVMAEYIDKFQRHGVRVVELELYEDLGQPGPSVAEFARQFAGPAAANQDWRFGVASAELTRRYDPEDYLDIYYLLDSQGRIAYINSSPAATIEPLLAHVKALQ